MKQNMIFTAGCILILAFFSRPVTAVSKESATPKVLLSVQKKIDRENERKKNKPVKRDAIGFGRFDKRPAMSTVTYKHEIEKVLLAVKLRNATKIAGDFTLEWYVFGEVAYDCYWDPKGTKKHNQTIRLVEKGSQNISLKSAESVVKKITCKELRLTEGSVIDEFLDHGDEEKRPLRSCGASFEGYTVLLKHEGKIIASHTSSDKFMDEELLNQKIFIPPTMDELGLFEKI